MVNLSAKNRDYAIFTPAISGFYVGYVSKQRYGEYVEKSRIPVGFENGIEGLNFLNPDKGYFTYDHALYSAGHAELNLEKANEKESMIQERHPGATIIGDSGGFQISKGVWQGNWLAPEGTDSKTDAVRQKVVDWLEHTANYSMVLDIPTNGLNFVDEVTGKPKCGLSSYEEFRDATIENNKYFMNHRQGKTKFLNVMQGSNFDEADDWFEKVGMEIVDHTHGWAFGGVQKTDLRHSLRRILYLKEMQLLEKSEWMHFLGTGKIHHGLLYTAIQKAVRKHVNPNFTISFDCASPYIAVANGRVYTNTVFTGKKMSYTMEFMVDDKMPTGKDEPWPWDNSPVGERLLWRDINPYNKGDLNKNGKEGYTSWDSFAYALMMGHNTYRHIEAIQMANRLAARPSKQITTWLPSAYLEFFDLVDHMMNQDYGKDMKAIEQAIKGDKDINLKLFKELNKFDLTKENNVNDLFEFVASDTLQPPVELQNDIDEEEEELR